MNYPELTNNYNRYTGLPKRNVLVDLITTLLGLRIFLKILGNHSGSKSTNCPVILGVPLKNTGLMQFRATPDAVKFSKTQLWTVRYRLIKSSPCKIRQPFQRGTSDLSNQYYRF